MSSDKDETPKDGAAKPAAKSGKKKLAIIGAAAAVVLLGGGGGAYMMLGGKAEAEAPAGEHGAAKTDAKAAGEAKGGEHGGGEGGGEEGGEGAVKPFDVPPMLVNLRSSDGAPHFLKIHVVLMPGDGTTEEALKEKLPILLDSYQPFLRELRPEDLSGSAAVFRIKEELLVRAHDALGDGVVKEVLVQDLIQQ